jgi:hypothetical protein
MMAMDQKRDISPNKEHWKSLVIGFGAYDFLSSGLTAGLAVVFAAFISIGSFVLLPDLVEV